VTSSGRVVGLVAAMVQLDERLENAADLILTPGESWGLEVSSEASDGINTPYQWSRTLGLEMQGFRLSVTTNRLQSAGSGRALPALVLGALITGLVARLTFDSQRRRQTDREIEWLRRSTSDKDRFLAGVGHELRTPLTVVVGMLDLASDPDRELTADERAELMTTARVHAQEMARLVDDFVTAGRLSANALTVRSQPTDLDPLIARVIASAPADGRLQVKTDTGLGTCLGDGHRISQILLNLLGNARRNANHLIEIAGHVDDRFVTLEVRNDGPAVAADLGDGPFRTFHGGATRRPASTGRPRSFCFPGPCPSYGRRPPLSVA